MKRRTLDIIFSVGGLALALLLLILGLVLQNQANFAEDYVHDQLAAQRITFTPADNLSDEETKSSCLVKYVSDQLTTGKQAECYANGYIALHLSEVNDGKTYAETSGESRRACSRGRSGREVRASISGDRCPPESIRGAERQGPDAVSRRDPPRTALDVVWLQHLRRACPAVGVGGVRSRVRAVSRIDRRVHPRVHHSEGADRRRRRVTVQHEGVRLPCVWAAKECRSALACE